MGGHARLERLARPAIGTYRRQCAREGVDPDVELATARLAHNRTAADWILCRLLTARDGFDPAVPTIEIAAQRVNRRHPVSWWALYALTGIVARLHLAETGDADPRILAALAADPDDNVRWTTAICAQLPETACRDLAHDPCSTVRMMLASNMALPADVAWTLTADPDGTVRAALANQTRDRDIQTSLATSQDVSTRVALARNQRLHHDAAVRLGEDRRVEVRVELARNGATPESVRSWLTTDGAAPVRLACFEGLALAQARDLHQLRHG